MKYQQHWNTTSAQALNRVFSMTRFRRSLRLFTNVLAARESPLSIFKDKRGHSLRFNTGECSLVLVEARE